MKLFGLIFVALMFFLPFGVAEPQISRVDNSNHHIVIHSLLERAACSSTAVGPHTLITAAHCDLGTDDIKIDDRDAKIIQKVYDGQDHMLLVTDDTFANYLPIDETGLSVGEHVRIDGWPGEHKGPVYREGVIDEVRSEDSEVPEGFEFTLPVYAGDSGSGVVNDQGKIVTVVSLGDHSAHMLAFDLKFSQSPLSQIK